MDTQYLNQDEKGLTSYQLKLIAMFLMLLDHIYYYFSYTNMIPIQFKWVGRIVAPLFIFVAQEGFYHTRSRVKMLLRLYLFSVGMNLITLKINTLFPRPDGIIMMHSMFSTIFLVGVYISLYDYMIDNFKRGEKAKSLIAFIGMILPLAINILLFINIEKIPQNLYFIIANFIPLPLLVEGSFVFIALGLMLYVYRNNKVAQSLVIIMVSITLMPIQDMSIQNMFTYYNWMMIFSLPFIWAYNGQKGKGMKYLFYIFYPAHIYILYLLSVFLYK